MTTTLRIAAAAAVLATAASATVGFDNCTDLFVIKSSKPHKPKSSVEVCREGHLAIAYDVEMMCPAWSAYYITPADIQSNIHGRLDFYEDPDLRALNVQQASTESPAFNESWNKGHCAPSRIMSGSHSFKRACYTMANIAPQQGYFNQHPWERLESLVYDWVGANSSLHIMTGVAYISRDTPRRTFGDVAVPDYYWKVLCDKTRKTSVGFIGRNDDIPKGDREAMFTMRSVQEIEQYYGGALFPYEQCNTHVVNSADWWTYSGGAGSD